MSVNIDMVVCKGGLDQITPTLSLPNTYARNCINFEAASTGGYNRIAGYERFDGATFPTYEATKATSAQITLDALLPGFIEGSSIICVATGAEAHVVRIEGTTLSLNALGGDWSVGDVVSLYSPPPPYQTVGTVTAVTTITPRLDAIIKGYTASLYRGAITDPGYADAATGRVLGVVELNDVTYAFRHDSTGTQINVYKSGGVFGWEAVPFLKTISFTGGKTLPSEGDRIKQGAVTATIRRIVRNSGSWQYGDAAGQFIIDTLAGGNFIAGAADMVEPSPSPTVVGTCTLAGAQTDISLTAHTSSTTKFEFAEYDFLAGTSTNRVYGCDGVNRAFEFDGEILVPLVTGPAGTAEGDGKPTHVCCHKGYLFLSIGAFFMHSAPGLPYCWDALENAGRLDIGGDVTNMITMPGGTNTATMGITSRTNTYILYGGGVSDWSLVPYNTGTGGRPWTAQNMSQTYLFDDRGVQSLQTTLQYGNFAQSVLTNQVLTFINERINKVTCATLCRRKNQYRVFFDDGYALFITIVNGKLLGCMPVYFPDPVFCVYEGKRSTGEDVIFFGSTNGYVYQMEKGTSFDGDAIDFNLAMNYSNAKSPRTLKRYRKCIPELSAASGTYAEFDFSYILGYDSAEYDQDLSKSYNRYGGNVRWDSFTWDNTFWDVKNTNMVECEMDGTAENVAVMISGSSDYVPEFTVNSFLLHYTPRRMMR